MRAAFIVIRRWNVFLKKNKNLIMQQVAYFQIIYVHQKDMVKRFFEKNSVSMIEKYSLCGSF